MRYLITSLAFRPFLSESFDYIDFNIGMIVYDLELLRFYDGDWHNLESNLF